MAMRKNKKEKTLIHNVKLCLLLLSAVALFASALVGCSVDRNRPEAKSETELPQQRTQEEGINNTSASPVIKKQPSDQRVSLNGTATFQVKAEGKEPLKYTWQVDRNDGKSWTQVIGANRATYTIDNVTKQKNGWKYRCIIGNSAGRVASESATLTVDG